jgi:hypothetical protein
MTIVGFNFTKISIERKGEPKGRVDINNNISIKDVVAANFGLGKTKEKGVRISYEFTSNYNPDIAEILIAGDVLFIGEENDEILKGWKKDKKMPKEIMQDLLNTIMMRCSVESMILTKDLNLPPPIPFPRLQESTPDKGKNEYIG